MSLKILSSDRPSEGLTVPETGLVVGFAGGVGSGKSAVAIATAESLVAGGLAVTIIDGDGVGHETLADPTALVLIEKAFGSTVVQDGVVDRQVLARLVIGDNETQVSNRSRLESIMHPIMRDTFAERMNAARTNGEIVLFDAAVMFESNWDELCDACVFVDTEHPVREARAISRGWTSERWQQTEASQWSVLQKRAAVAAFESRGYLVENIGEISSIGEAVASWIKSTFLASSENTSSMSGKS